MGTETRPPEDCIITTIFLEALEIETAAMEISVIPIGAEIFPELKLKTMAVAMVSQPNRTLEGNGQGAAHHKEK